MFHNDNHVITGNCVVLWDGITKPEALDGGGFKHNLKVAQLMSNPENGELQVILDRELQNGEFRGMLPAGGLPGMSDTRPGEFGDMIPGHKVLNSVTYNGAPDVYDVNGQKLDPMQYGQMLYPGATVQLIVSARTYSNKSKGLGFWLNGIKIIDATTPKLPVGGGSIDAGAAFAAAPQQPVQQQQAPMQQQPVQQQPVQQQPVQQQPVQQQPVQQQQVITPATDFLNVNGQQCSVEQLRSWGWDEAGIAAAR